MQEGFLSQPADGGLAFGCSGMLLGVRHFPPERGVFLGLGPNQKG